MLSHTTRKQLALAVAGNCSFREKGMHVESPGVHYIDDLDMAGGESHAIEQRRARITPSNRYSKSLSFKTTRGPPIASMSGGVVLRRALVRGAHKVLRCEKPTNPQPVCPPPTSQQRMFGYGLVCPDIFHPVVGMSTHFKAPGQACPFSLPGYEAGAAAVFYPYIFPSPPLNNVGFPCLQNALGVVLLAEVAYRNHRKVLLLTLARICIQSYPVHKCLL